MLTAFIYCMISSALWSSLKYWMFEGHASLWPSDMYSTTAQATWQIKKHPLFGVSEC